MQTVRSNFNRPILQTALPGGKIIFCHQIMKMFCALCRQTRVTGLWHKLCHIIKSAGFANDRKDATLKEDALPKLDQVKLTYRLSLCLLTRHCVAVFRPDIGASQMRRRCVRLTHSVASLQGTGSVQLNDVLCASSPPRPRITTARETVPRCHMIIWKLESLVWLAQYGVLKM